jgi:hypothetical protein
LNRYGQWHRDGPIKKVPRRQGRSLILVLTAIIRVLKSISPTTFSLRRQAFALWHLALARDNFLFYKESQDIDAKGCVARLEAGLESTGYDRVGQGRKVLLKVLRDGTLCFVTIEAQPRQFSERLARQDVARFQQGIPEHGYHPGALQEDPGNVRFEGLSVVPKGARQQVANLAAREDRKGRVADFLR